MIFEEKESIEVKIDPRVKLLSLLFFFLISFLPSKLYSSLSLFMLSIFLSFPFKIQKIVFRARFLLTTVFLFTVLLWMISKGFGYIESSVVIALRLDTMIVGGIIFISITRQEELFFALRKFLIPFRASFAISLSMRFVPVILNLIDTVVQAQRARGYGIVENPFRKLQKVIPLIGPVLLFVLRWTDRLSIALETRGFSSKKRSDYYQWKMKSKDFLILLLLFLLFVLVLFLRMRKLI